MKIAAALLGLALMTTLQAHSEVSKKDFGKMPDGTPIEQYTLKDGKVEVDVITYGGIVTNIRTPDRNGKIDDIVLGFDTLDDYVNNNKPYFGAIIGRYANRIAHGTFKLDGKTYNVPKNDGDNALHGGKHGFDKVVWKAREVPNGVELTYVSPDGEQGFPGALTTRVRYALQDNTLRIEYRATTDKDTVLNLTNHSYFNLSGQGSGDVLKDQVTIHASKYTPVDKNLIPTGQIALVAGTPFDFTKGKPVGQDIDSDNEQLKLGLGYDHNFVLENGGSLKSIAMVADPNSGRTLEVWTDQPGVQLYTGNHLDGTVKGKGGHAYAKREALCLETQHFPDSPNHPKFPTTELHPQRHFYSVTLYKFGTK